MSGVGGAPDERRRQEEFDTRDEAATGELLDGLKAAVGDADAVLAGLEPAQLAERVRIQGRDVTVLSAIYHVVEHFAGHTYQIAYVTKSSPAPSPRCPRSQGSFSWTHLPSEPN